MSDIAIYGSAFAQKRYEVYRHQVSWNYHSTYKTMDIEHAFTVTGTGEIKPRGLYRAAVWDGKGLKKELAGYIVGEGLKQIKDGITLFRGGKEGKA